MSYIDMLARFGAGSAHPGGFSATLAQLRQYPMPAGCRVLEIGCGTGKTASYLAAQGYQVTGIDLHETMIRKAQQRAALEGTNARFQIADAAALPFADASYDVILAESVLNFTPLSTALKEMERVLAPGGRLLARELFAQETLPKAGRQQLVNFFGLQQLMTLMQWETLLQETGFAKVELSSPEPLQVSLTEDEAAQPDRFKFLDPDALMDPALWQIQFQHDQLLTRYERQLGHVLICASKA